MQINWKSCDVYMSVRKLLTISHTNCAKAKEEKWKYSLAWRVFAKSVLWQNNSREIKLGKWMKKNGKLEVMRLGKCSEQWAMILLFKRVNKKFVCKMLDAEYWNFFGRLKHSEWICCWLLCSVLWMKLQSFCVRKF